MQVGPFAQDPRPEQAMLHVAPAQYTSSAHEPRPAQVTVFVAAYVDTVELHEPIPSHVVVQESPEQVMESEQLF